MNVNRATTASAGFASGSRTSVKIRTSEQPSILAASLSSIGMVLKNCRSKKIENALPKKAGTQSGRKEPTQPSHLKRPNVGTIKTGKGTIMVASVTAKKKSRPGQRRRAKAYATTALEQTDLRHKAA